MQRCGQLLHEIAEVADALIDGPIAGELAHEGAADDDAVGARRAGVRTCSGFDDAEADAQRHGRLRAQPAQLVEQSAGSSLRSPVMPTTLTQ